MHFTKPEGT